MQPVRLLVFTAVLLLLSVWPGFALEIKIASVAPDGSQWMQEMRKGAAEIKERSSGRVVFKFYGGGVMGNEKNVLRKIRIGQLHGGAFTGGGLTEVSPDLQLYSLPFTFRNLAEVDHVRARLDQELQQRLEKAGFVSFGFAEGGFAQLMGTIQVRSIEDLKGRKCWVPEGDTVSYAVIESFGLSPVTLPISDVLTGLQTGLVEVIGSSPIGAIALQWHTRVKFMTTNPLAYIFATLAVDRKTFERLSPEDQALVREVMGRVYRGFDSQNRKDDQAARQALSRQGIVSVAMTASEEQRWRDMAAAVNGRLAANGTFDAVLYGRLQQLLAEARSNSLSPGKK